MRCRLLTLTLIVAHTALACAADGRTRTSQRFTVRVPPKVHMLQADGGIEFRGTIPMLIHAVESSEDTENASVQATWQMQTSVGRSTVIRFDRINNVHTRFVTLTIVPLD